VNVNSDNPAVLRVHGLTINSRFVSVMARHTAMVVKSIQVRAKSSCSVLGLIPEFCLRTLCYRLRKIAKVDRSMSSPRGSCNCHLCASLPCL
jgi:hypothetical protein